MKRLLLIGALVAAFPAAAQATTLDVTCQAANFDLGAEPPNRSYALYVDGDIYSSGQGAGRFGVPFIPELEGNGTVTLYTGSFRYPFDLSKGQSLEAPYSCPAPPVAPPEQVPYPEPPAPPPVVVVPEPEPVRPSSCPPALRNVYRNGAGPRWVNLAVARGCVAKIGPPPAVTCPPALRNVLRSGAGPKWVRIARERGCIAPAPTTPKVAG